MSSMRSATASHPEQPIASGRNVEVLPEFCIVASSAAQRRMKCSGLSRCGEPVGDDEDGRGETGGSATEVLPPLQALTNNRGAVSAQARMRRTTIEAMPPERAADVVFRLLTSPGLGEQVVEQRGTDVVVVREVHHLECRAGGDRRIAEPTAGSPHPLELGPGRHAGRNGSAPMPRTLL